MKNIQHTFLALLLILILSPSDTFAQNYTRWDLPEGAKLRIGKGDPRNITFSPDGKRMYVESTVGIWIYDMNTGVELDFIAESPFTILGVSPDTSMYVTLDSANNVQLRDMTDGSVKGTLNGNMEGIRRIAFSPNGSTLASVKKREVLLWDVATGEQTALLEGHTGWVASVAFSPDGSTLASGSWDDTVRLWDVATGTHENTLYHRDSIRTVAFSPNGKILAGTCYNQRSLRLWDTATGHTKAEYDLSSVIAIGFSPDSSTLATGNSGGQLHLWDVATGNHKAELTGHQDGYIFSIVFSQDGKTLASCSSNDLFLWDALNGERILSITGHTDGVNGLAFSPDSQTIATGAWDKVHLWNSNTGTHKAMVYVGGWGISCDSLAFSTDGNTLASQFDSRQVLLWDVERSIYIGVLRGYGGNPLTSSSRFASLAFSPDGRLLANGHEFNTAVHLWYAGRTHIGALTGHTEGVTSIDFSHDSRLLASGGNDKTVRLWDVDSRTTIATFSGHTDEVHGVAFNPDSSILASCSKDNTIILWNVATGESRVIPTEYIEGVRSIAFSVDGRTIASCGGWEDPDVHLWDVATGEIKRVLIGHSEGVLKIAFSPDGRTFASGSVDGTVLLWDFNSILDTGRETLHRPEDVNGDGVVDLQDLIFVASQFGQPGDENAADVNVDGVINIADILLVAAALNNDNGAPSRNSQSIESLTAAEVQQWLMQAQQVNSSTLSYQKGIAVLEQLLAMLTPKKTGLLANYPNPFNPETWIPYQLANPADVIIRIYSADGRLVRALELGHQRVGIYQNRSRAAYWDGKNEFGEPVASGIYFYTLSAGKFTATRRMVIRK